MTDTLKERIAKGLIKKKSVIHNAPGPFAKEAQKEGLK